MASRVTGRGDVRGVKPPGSGKTWTFKAIMFAVVAALITYLRVRSHDGVWASRLLLVGYGVAVALVVVNLLGWRARVRRSWAHLTDSLGLSYLAPDTGLRLPALVELRRRPGGFVVRVRMLPGQTPAAYVAAGEAFAHAWGMHRVDVSSDARGRVELRAWRTDPLAVTRRADLVGRHGQAAAAHRQSGVPDRPDPEPPSPTARPAAAVPVWVWGPDDAFPLAYTDSGQPVSLSLARSAHGLVAGTTRSGKSIAANVLLANASIRRAVRTIVLDPNAVAAAPWYRTAWRVSLDTHPAEPTRILREVREEMESRKALLVANRADRITQFSDACPVLLVVVDEVANYTRHADKSAAKEFETELMAIAAQGAKFGVRLWLYTQKPSSEVLATAVRSNLTARLCFRVETTEDYLMAFPEGRELAITAADRTMPQGVAVASVGDMRVPALVRGVLLETGDCWTVSDAICANGGQVRAEPTFGQAA